MTIAERTVLVSGANRGIGQALARPDPGPAAGADGGPRHRGQRAAGGL